MAPTPVVCAARQLRYDGRMTCPVCRADRACAEVGRYLRCPACGALFLATAPGASSLEAFSGAAATAREAADQARAAWFAARLDEALRHAPPPSGPCRLVDIGCGAGILLGAAAARGWEVAAIELSPELAARARARVPAARVVVGDAVTTTDWPWPGKADVVVALDVLEHVVDPPALLARCRQGLRPGGVLLLQTPNARSLRARWQGARWPMLDPDQHLVLYPPRELRRALERAGFAVERCRTVSGTGLEQGAGRAVAAAREAVLAAGGLGNALRLLARAV